MMLDLPRIMEKCYRMQWRVDELDWDAPGRERVSDAQAASLAGFMGDLYWIEFIASVIFEAMEAGTDDATLRSVFASFAVDELRHADAELALMRRWGMVGASEKPSPNVNVRWLLADLEKNAKNVNPAIFSAIIPMTELVLDGALVRYLDGAIEDPLCHEVFEKINADEARHLAVDFHVLEKYGKERSILLNGAELARAFVSPFAVHAMLLGYVPMLARSRRNIEKAGLDLDEVRRCLRRYVALGESNPDVARHPAYRMMSAFAARLADGKTGFGDTLVRLSDAIDAIG